MGTLRRLKEKIRSDRKWRWMLLRSSGLEILLDLDGDREADIALLSVTGDIEYLAVDITSCGEFDLYIGDTDENGIPEIFFQDKKCDIEQLSAIFASCDICDLIMAASLVRSAVITGDYILDTLEEKMDDLWKQILKVQSELRKRSGKTA